MVKRLPGRAKRPLVGDFYAVGVAVVGVVDLGGQAAQRRFLVADQAEEQAGLLVEEEAERRLALRCGRRPGWCRGHRFCRRGRP